MIRKRETYKNQLGKIMKIVSSMYVASVPNREPSKENNVTNSFILNESVEFFETRP